MQKYHNLSMKKKISLGFVVVIFLSIVMAVISTIMNIESGRKMNEMNRYSELQTVANSALDDFNEARINAATVIAIIDEDAAKGFNESIARTNTKIDILIQKTNEVNPSYNDSLNQMKAALAQWEADTNAVIRINQELADNGNALRENQFALRELSLQMLNTVPDGNFTAAQSTAQLIHSMNVAFSSSGEMVDRFNVEALDDIIAKTEEATAAANAILSLGLGGRTDTFVNEILSGLELYQQQLTSYHDSMVECLVYMDKSVERSTSIAAGTTQFLLALDQTTTEMTIAAEKATTTGTLVIIAVAVLVVVFSVLIAMLLISSILNPIKILTHTLEFVGKEGRMVLSEEESKQLDRISKGKDEISQSMLTLKQMLQRLNYISDSLMAISKGDLRQDISLASESDTIGLAMKNMVDSLNLLFKEIQSASDQVASSSNMIASGAQALASGATQQAASVQELSATIFNVKVQAEKNTDLARKSYEETKNAGVLMGESMQHMQQLSDSMDEIKNSSQNIAKVIKVIDDIAFQTNILALNAAVEAARAGQHGKGFAVVADEVRNLASKSADAAKETAVLIQKSVEQVGKGSAMAEKTEKSLIQVGELAKSSLGYVSEISSASEEQSDAIKEITIGMEQISIVVQSNSATAEESAASSQEMNAQSNLLKTIVSRFQLKQDTLLLGGKKTELDMAGTKKQYPQFSYPENNAFSPSTDEIIF